jgi:hypothetical protein
MPNVLTLRRFQNDSSPLQGPPPCGRKHRIIDPPIPRDPSSVGAGVSPTCSVNRPPRRLEWIHRGRLLLQCKCHSRANVGKEDWSC